jgi:ATP-dependent protease Clp ATPase subunit
VKETKVGRLKLHKLRSALEDEHLHKVLNKQDERLYKQYKRKYEDGEKEREFSYRA